MKIYLVRGSIGEYCEHQEWSVCAFYSREQAEKEVEELSRQLAWAQVEFIRRRRAINTAWGYPPYHEESYGDNKDYLKEVCKLQKEIEAQFFNHDPKYPILLIIGYILGMPNIRLKK